MAAGLQEAGALGEAAPGILEVLQDLGQEHRVGVAVRQRHLVGGRDHVHPVDPVDELRDVVDPDVLAHVRREQRLARPCGRTRRRRAARAHRPRRRTRARSRAGGTRSGFARFGSDGASGPDRPLRTVAAREGSCDEARAFHLGRNGLAEQLEQRRSDVAQVALGPTTRLDALSGENVEALVGVVGVVGAGVVLEDVDGAGADLADASPVEVAEVDEEVGGDAAARSSVEVLRAVCDRADRPALVVAERLELLLQLARGRARSPPAGMRPSGSRPPTFRKSRQ